MKPRYHARHVFYPASTTSFRLLDGGRFTVAGCRIEGGELVRTYRRGWQRKTIDACNLSGVRRTVLLTLIAIGDHKARSRISYRELAKLSGVGQRSCCEALQYLTDNHFVAELEHGKGRKPSMFQVTECQVKETL